MTTKTWDCFACKEPAVQQWSTQSALLTLRVSKNYSIRYNRNRNSLCDHLTLECQAMQIWFKRKLGPKAKPKDLCSLQVFWGYVWEEKTQSRQPWARADPSTGRVTWTAGMPQVQPGLRNGWKQTDHWKGNQWQGHQVIAGARTEVEGMSDVCRGGSSWQNSGLLLESSALFVWRLPETYQKKHREFNIDPTLHLKHILPLIRTMLFQHVLLETCGRARSRNLSALGWFCPLCFHLILSQIYFFRQVKSEQGKISSSVLIQVWNYNFCHYRKSYIVKVIQFLCCRFLI